MTFKAAPTRGCLIKKFPNVLPNYAKIINSKVKSQTECQIFFQAALKWGIVHLCTLSNSRDTIKFRKLSDFQYLHFFKKNVESLCKIPKNSKIQNIDTFCFQSYLQYYLTYIDIQYLIFNPNKGGIVATPQSRYASAISRPLEITSFPLMSFNFKISPKHRWTQFWNFFTQSWEISKQRQVVSIGFEKKSEKFDSFLK